MQEGRRWTAIAAEALAFGCDWIEGKLSSNANDYTKAAAAQGTAIGKIERMLEQTKLADELAKSMVERVQEALEEEGKIR